jgi:cysteinyl-tRNA synthetase
MKIYNSYSKKKEEFIPIATGKVGMYGCGITPYKPSHLGHAMQAVIFDVMRRYFEYQGYQVTYVRNYTDVDDKIINTARSLHVNALDHARNIMEQCERDFKALRVRSSDVEPKVSDHIPDIIRLVSKLIDKKLAYATNLGNVYYIVRKFLNYGHLSNQNIDSLQHGTRKQVEQDKKDPLDFALWKTADNEDEIYWDSPWGKGRPGWHIECSAMSEKYLGMHFDIHGGGGDLMFPHHENEIAQSEAAHDCTFANYWIHNGLLMVGKEKMSKSLNNDVSLKDWLQLYHPETIRYLILTNHYRSHVQFVSKRYIEANKKVYQIYNILYLAQKATTSLAIDADIFNELIKEFEAYMDNDFNTVQVIAMINKLVGDIAQELEKNNDQSKDLRKVQTYYTFIIKVGTILGLFDLEPETVIQEMKHLELSKRSLTTDQIERQIDERNLMRATGDYTGADKVRNSLLQQGISIADSSTKTNWDISFEE